MYWMKYQCGLVGLQSWQVSWPSIPTSVHVWFVGGHWGMHHWKALGHLFYYYSVDFALSDFSSCLYLYCFCRWMLGSFAYTLSEWFVHSVASRFSPVTLNMSKGNVPYRILSGCILYQHTCRRTLSVSYGASDCSLASSVFSMGVATTATELLCAGISSSDSESLVTFLLAPYFSFKCCFFSAFLSAGANGCFRC